MMRAPRGPKPVYLQTAVALGALLLVLAIYAGMMRLTIDVSRPELGHSIEHRDSVYFWIHTGVLVAAAVAGFILGKWLNGLGFAYALLFFAVVAVGMAALQLGSHALACEGQNDIIRHWVC